MRLDGTVMSWGFFFLSWWADVCDVCGGRCVVVWLAGEARARLSASQLALVLRPLAHLESVSQVGRR